MSFSPRPKRLLLTGGRGRLAPLIADHFSTNAFTTELFSRTPDVGLLPLDSLMEAETTNRDAILHLGWSTLPATSEKHVGMEEREDLPWLERLLDRLARQEPERRAHLIFFSSGGTVYGNAPGRPSRESDECGPIGRYGRAKLAAEKMILAGGRAGLPAAVLRISNPYGYPVPGRRPQGIVPHAIRAAVEGTPLTLWGDGQARKDFVYYTDFLAALDLVIQQRLEGVYNVSSGSSHRINEIIECVETHTRRRITIDRHPAPPWDVVDSRLDSTRLAEATGWHPLISLDEGVRRSVAAYQDH